VVQIIVVAVAVAVQLAIGSTQTHLVYLKRHVRVIFKAIVLQDRDIAKTVKTVVDVVTFKWQHLIHSIKKVIMKTLAVLFFTIFFSVKCFSERTVVCGLLKTKQRVTIRIYEPVHGYENSSFYKGKTNISFSPNSDSFHYILSSKNPAAITFYITNEDGMYITKSILALFPNDSVHLTIDLGNDDSQLFIYTGSNALGHKLFNDINDDPIFKFKGVITSLNNLKNNTHHFIEEIDNCISGFTKRFDSLLIKSQITRQFNGFNKITFSQLLYGFVINKFLFNYKQREVFTKKERDSIVSSFYTKQPVSDPAVKSTYNSFFYVQNYYLFEIYKGLNIESFEPMFEERTSIVDGKEYVIGNECGKFLYIKDKQQREYLWAMYMLIVMRMVEPGSFNETIRQFKDIFPNSKWIEMLDNQVADIKPRLKVNYIFQSPIKYIDSTKSIHSVIALMNELPEGKPIFLDLWATWCAPCIESFRYNKELDSFLVSNNVERLYISLDFKASDLKWRSAIEQYALGGFHIIAGEKLADELKTICGIKKEDGFRIPRYMLISKDKKIVLTDAISPANTRLLMEQIKKLLL